ncbi:hypothetical protein SAMN02745823_01565 [Sporobacter termitidis DSM 10068]|uniref:Pyridinium-3,5-bisthiocarboxylic acid mononucleotide nickel insertion protein n=1 Tax=Sporobacter termitidis DSM 10068 TaxID=1123282 RepID=A0A1M5X307_9FIRM|nr:nickel pincer cofactor biosynthesis protein LarC [Sporobacter termitidis]SHH94266.1 hypothetical protein SAMN02745823_01565 [Sporobacter termitidis DSM 10068]
MKLYIECNMGAAGDMLMGALLELLPDRDIFLQRMRSLGLPRVDIGCDFMTKCGVTGTKMRIRIGGEEESSHDAFTDAPDAPESRPDHEPPREHEHSHAHEHDEHEHEHEHTHEHTHGGDVHAHAHYSYNDICEIIKNLDLAENVKDHALAVYKLIGEAEAAVHGVPLGEIRFHEVGSFDAIVDIVGCCLLFQMLGVTNIEASPVHVGSGFVRCAHGILPVPAPATAHILQGVPIYGGKINGELCTPTGAALLKHFVRRFGDMEPMAVTKIGYGMGAKDFEAANCVRAFLSDRPETKDTVSELRCNLDDMTPEAIGYVTELLLSRGALDVFTTPITMKKSRPAVMLTCLCAPDDKNEMSRLLLENTTTLGIRYETLKRDVLDKTSYKVKTIYGDIRIKSARGYGIVKEKPEYDDVRAAAAAHNVPFSRVYAAAAAEMKSVQGQ